MLFRSSILLPRKLLELSFRLLGALLEDRQIRPGAACSQEPAGHGAQSKAEEKKCSNFHVAF